ncbi:MULTISPECIES: sodium-dependent transporter [Methanobrevibacter]|uniref:NSS family neurotransmitter:Na+ symporter n=1 Tax=Methanobrevibacter gottschalkii DSM 11977 TaxID=1122229 RepID=A0A3N5B5T6_9EURY|nr:MULTISPECIES: sodium-dependent transporter [Methanobrevibacter]OEC99211.1 sodium:calcium symporter [Methanobrevibacter sp. A27]RPF53026.1 NSS family neurotransmitter:Na+ symporter [Methanobrevibacter gottschalkii DSM 11977]
MSEQPQWDSSISFIFAMIGAAVGLGNIWRFSYVLYSNGGGSFFIPYLIAIAIMGIPFLILEYGVGFSFKESFSSIMRKIKPEFEVIAWILVLFVFVVTIYYLVILSWDLVYLFSSFTFNWGTDTASYFVNTVGGSSDLTNANFLLIPTTVCVLLLWISVWFISHRDVDSGIGRVSKILIPALFVIMGIIIVYALTLPGSVVGINALIHPNWNGLLNVNIWLAAFAQIIFSLSMGQAIAITYASYLPKNSKLIDNVLIVVFANSAFEVCTAFGVFSILGYMSFINGTPITDLITEGTGLVFIVFPMIFNIMGSVGRILAPMLFLAILFAGITSALGYFEPMLSSTSAKLGWSRKKAASVLSIIGCAFSVLLTTGISSYVVGIIDSFVNEFGILLLIGVQCIIFAWVYGVEHFLPLLNEYSSFTVGKKWIFVIKYLLPFVLIIMWVVGIVQLFTTADVFEIAIDLIIIASVLVSAVFLTKLKPSGE